MRLILSLFRLPFWVFLAAAGGLFYLGELSHRDTLAKNQELERALAGQPPQTVSLAEFDPEQNIGLADEISVQGVINPSYNYELTKRRKGPDTTRYLYVLFDAADTEATRIARGAMVLSEAEKDRFINAYYAENSEISVGEAGIASVITFNGQVQRTPDLSSMVRDAFDEQGLKRSENFIYIEPFLNGRAAGLSPTVSADEMRDLIRSVGLGAALIGVLKLVLRRRRRSKSAAEATAATTETAAPLLAPVEAGGFDTTDDGDEPIEEETPKRKKSLLARGLAIILLAGAAAYSGYGPYIAVFVAIVLVVLAARKVGKVIGGGLGRLGVSVPGVRKSDDAVMAKVQAEIQTDAATEEADTGYGAFVTSVETAVQAPRDEVCEPEPEDLTHLAQNDDIMARLMSDMQSEAATGQAEEAKPVPDAAPAITPEPEPAMETRSEAATGQAEEANPEPDAVPEVTPEPEPVMEMQSEESPPEPAAEESPVAKAIADSEIDARQSAQPRPAPSDMDLSRAACEAPDEDMVEDQEEMPMTEMQAEPAAEVTATEQGDEMQPPASDHFDLGDADAPRKDTAQDEPEVDAREAEEPDHELDQPLAARDYMADAPFDKLEAMLGAEARSGAVPEADKPKRGFKLPLPKFAFRSKSAVENVVAEMETQPEAAPEIQESKRGFRLPIPKFPSKSKIMTDSHVADSATGPEPEQETHEPKRGFSFALPMLGRKSEKAADDPEAAAPVETQEEPAPKEESPRRGFRLSLPGLGRKAGDEAEIADTPAAATMQADAPMGDEAPKRGFRLSLPGLGRKAKDAADIADAPAAMQAEVLTGDEKSKRGFKLSLPRLGRKAKGADDKSAKPVAKTKPRKEALQSATSLVAEDASAQTGLAAKVQLLMARLAPAEREPKAFADLPDPFDRLAAEVQRSAAR